MNKPVGGRGHKANYQTMVIRVPIYLKPQIDRLVAQFRKGTLDDSQALDLQSLIDRYKLKSKSSRDWVQFNKFIKELGDLENLSGGHKIKAVTS